MPSGSICEPPLMVSVAVVLMNGRTPMLVYTSGLVVPTAAAAAGAADASPAAAVAPLPRRTSRRLTPAVDRLRILYILPIEFERYLHLSRVVGLTGDRAKGSAVQVRAGSREHRAVQKVERLPAKIDAFAFPDPK